MIARALPLLLLLAAAPAPEPESDPFLAALAGKSGPDAVAAPSFDPDLEACSWSLRPRREIVDALAARLLRGEAKSWYEPAKEAPVPPPLPSRFPADFEAGKVEVSDRLAARVPADAAAVFFGSLTEAEVCIEGLSGFVPRALPVLGAPPAGGRDDALARAVESLLLPTIWRSNPAVQRGTRQAAVLVADPDVRGAPEVALVVEVEDASLVRFHRQSTLSFENRGTRRLRVEGLDATADDGSVRSFFALEGGIAVWSTGKAFRDRILAAAAGKAATLLTPDPRAYALARATFPPVEGQALLVVPDGFLERTNSAGIRARRAAALRCDAARLVAGTWSLSKAPRPEGLALDCPSGGTITIAAGTGAGMCSVHGNAAHRVPLGDQPAAPPVAFAGKDPVAAGAIPLAAAWRGGDLDVLVPPGRPGEALLGFLMPTGGMPASFRNPLRERRLVALRGAGLAGEAAGRVYEANFDESAEAGFTPRVLSLKGECPPIRTGGGVLRFGPPGPAIINECIEYLGFSPRWR